MKGILLLGAALLLASPALAGRFQNNETASSMNHINTADPDNPIYDMPTTPTSAASGNANFKGYRPKDFGAYGYVTPSDYDSSNRAEPAYPVYDAPYN